MDAYRTLISLNPQPTIPNEEHIGDDLRPLFGSSSSSKEECLGLDQEREGLKGWGCLDFTVRP